MHTAEIQIESPSGKGIYNEIHTAPASWSEMTGAHLLLWASVLGSSLERHNAEQQLAAFLYKIPLRLFKYISGSTIMPLAESVAFLFKKNKLNKWLIKSFRLGLMYYHGPKDGLANATISEFTLCEHCYTRFQDSRDLAYLETLAAILYRPRRFGSIDNDIRMPLTTQGYVRRAESFKKLTAGQKFATFLNYEGCRNFIHSKYPDVFTPGKRSKNSKSVAQPQWAKIIESASSDIFGTYDQTSDTNLHVFLSRLGTRIKEQRELEKPTTR